MIACAVRTGSGMLVRKASDDAHLVPNGREGLENSRKFKHRSELRRRPIDHILAIRDIHKRQPKRRPNRGRGRPKSAVTKRFHIRQRDRRA